MITIKKVESKKDLKAFIKFPNDLYKDNKNFVPIFDDDEKEEFDPKKNDAYSYSEAELFLAYSDDKIVGRVGCILNRAYNEKKDVQQVRFTRFDAIDNFEVFEKLIETVKNWALARGMNEIIGPMGFSDLDKQGMLLEGFDEMDMYLTIYNYPYYPQHLERLGFSKKADWLEFQLSLPEKMDDRIIHIADMVKNKYGYKVIHFKKKKDIYQYFPKALDIMNDAYAKLFGVVPLTKKQMDDYSKLLKLLTVKDYVYTVETKEGEFIGYGFMAPSLSKAVRKCKGKLFPTGIFHVLKALKTNDVIDLYSVGVKTEYQSKGVNALILCEGIKAAIRKGVKIAETGPELEDNLQVQGLWKYFNKRQHKRRRCYGLKLPNYPAEKLNQPSPKVDFPLFQSEIAEDIAKVIGEKVI